MGVDSASATRASEIVVRDRVLQPEQAVRLNTPAYLDRVVDAPELLDVTHQIHVWANSLAHDTHAFDRVSDGGLAATLHLHLTKAHLDEARAGLGQVFERVATDEGAAGVCVYAVAQAAEQGVDRTPICTTSEPTLRR